MMIHAGNGVVMGKSWSSRGLVPGHQDGHRGQGVPVQPAATGSRRRPAGGWRARSWRVRVLAAGGLVLAAGAVTAPASPASGTVSAARLAAVHPLLTGGTKHYVHFGRIVATVGLNQAVTPSWKDSKRARNCVIVGSIGGIGLQGITSWDEMLRTGSGKILWHGGSTIAERICSPWERHPGKVYTEVQVTPFTSISNVQTYTYTQ